MKTRMIVIKGEEKRQDRLLITFLCSCWSNESSGWFKPNLEVSRCSGIFRKGGVKGTIGVCQDYCQRTQWISMLIQECNTIQPVFGIGLAASYIEHNVSFNKNDTE